MNNASQQTFSISLVLGQSWPANVYCQHGNRPMLASKHLVLAWYWANACLVLKQLLWWRIPVNLSHFFQYRGRLCSELIFISCISLFDRWNVNRHYRTIKWSLFFQQSYFYYLPNIYQIHHFSGQFLSFNINNSEGFYAIDLINPSELFMLKLKKFTPKMMKLVNIGFFDQQPSIRKFSK